MVISPATTGDAAEPEDIPNGPGDPAPPPGPAPAGWRDIRPELSAEPYVFAAGSWRVRRPACPRSR